MSSSPASNVASNAGGNAFQLGWLMAGLYGPLQHRDDTSHGHLPTLNELASSDRVPLAIEEVGVRLEQLEAALDIPGQAALNAGSLTGAAARADFDGAVRSLHVEILGRLEANAPALSTAYSLGRALCDTCWRPTDQATVSAEFRPERVRELAGWMDEIKTVLPAEAAQAVSKSLSWWSDWLAEFSQVRGGWETAAGRVLGALKRQGERWRMLLANDQAAQSVLTLDGYVQAAECALERARQAAVRVAVKYWAPLSILLLMTAGLVWLAINYTTGAAKVWSTVGTLAAGMGVTGTSIRAGLRQVVSTAGRPLWAISQGEAIAAEITELPAFDLGSALRHTLRRKGVISATLPTDGRRKIFGDRTTRWRALLPPVSAGAERPS